MTLKKIYAEHPRRVCFEVVVIRDKKTKTDPAAKLETVVDRFNRDRITPWRI